jgi:hypothetical protein
MNAIERLAAPHSGDNASQDALAGLTGEVAGQVLRDLGRLMREAPAGGAATAAAMAETARRVALCLEAAEEAQANGDPDSAALEWARAQVLLTAMNRRRESKRAG